MNTMRDVDLLVDELDRTRHTLAVLAEHYTAQGEKLALAESNVRQLLATRDELQAAIKAIGKVTP